MPMHLRYAIYLIMLLHLLRVFSTPSVMANSQRTPCVAKNATLRCLKTHFKELYKTDYAKFWTILRTAEEKALGCKSVVDTADFLGVARYIEGNAEVGEYFSEKIEQLCTRAPQCLLDALTRLDRRSRREIVARLRAPTFVDQSTIDRVLRNYKTEKKYEEIMRLYFGP